MIYLFYIENTILNDLNGRASSTLTYLSLPFVPGFGDLLVSVAHHGDQHVYEQNRHDRHVQHEQQLQLVAIVFDVLLRGAYVNESSVTREIYMNLLPKCR